MRWAKDLIKSVLPQSARNAIEERYYARYGEVELHLLEFLCHRGKTSVDVGANDGCYVQVMRRYSKHVLAFEPMPDLAAGLRKKYVGPDVEHFEMALSNRKGVLDLHWPVVAGTRITGSSTIAPHSIGIYGATAHCQVQVRTLDSFDRQDVGFIKIDVEGHEQAVLEGAKGTIERNQPRVLVELVEELSPNSVKIATQFFDTLKYSGWFVHDGEVKPINKWSAEYQLLRNKPDLIAPLSSRKRIDNNYLYNFIYLPRHESPAVVDMMNRKMQRMKTGRR